MTEKPGIGNNLPCEVQGREVEELGLSLAPGISTPVQANPPTFVPDILCDSLDLFSPFYHLHFENFTLFRIVKSEMVKSR